MNKNKQILLIDDTLSINSINLESKIIISLDFESHKKLELKNVDHIISDIFISNNEINLSEKLCLRNFLRLSNREKS